MIDLRNGDCLEVLAILEDESVDAVVTDPPYGLGMRPWDYEIPGVDVWAECLRVLKPGGHMLCFAGSRTQHRMAVNIEDAGFELRDVVMWVYASGFPKAKGVLKPAYEPVVVARKPFRGSAKACVAEHGTGVLQIDVGRVPLTSGEKPWIHRGGEKPKFQGSCALAGEREYVPGHMSRSGGEAGRWPANFAHDGSEEVEALFPVTGPSKSSEDRGKGARGLKEDKPLGAFKEVEGGMQGGYDDEGGSAARFFYCAKVSSAERAKHPHPTPKPLELMRWLVRLGCPTGGTVLDPYMGSGATGAAALAEGMGFIGIELSPDYFATASARLRERDEPT